MSEFPPETRGVLSFFFLAFVLLLSASYALPSDKQTAYLFPLPVPGRPTGTFGENRGDHFHSGLDLSTGGKIGLTVRAPFGGVLHRLRCSPFGFGKAVYLRLADGRYAVFAHLDRFADRLQKIKDRRQEKSGIYDFDIYFPQEKIEFAAGEVVGYTGSSGTRFPHLHFELRDSYQRPLNPLTHGFSIGDYSSPVFEGAAIRPLDSSSFVNGSGEVIIVSDEPETGDEPVTVRGRFGIEAATIEKRDGNRLGVRMIELAVDGKTVFRRIFDRFSYKQYRLAPLVFDRYLSRKGYRDFQRLYRRGPDDRIFSADFPGSSGILQTVEPDEPGYLAPGKHRIRIRAENAAGEGVEMEFILLAKPEPLPGRPEPVPPIDPEKALLLETPDGNVRVNLPPRSLFYPVRLSVRPEEVADSGTLEQVGTAFRLEPDGLYCRHPVTVSLRIPDGEEENTAGDIAVYRGEDGNWKFIGNNTIGGDGWISAESRDSGLFSLFRDRKAPELRPGFREGVIFQNPRPLLTVTAADGGSDIDYSTMEVRLDGKTVPAEYQPYRERVVYRPRNRLASGNHRLNVKVSDRAGNTAEISSLFQIE